MGAWALGSSEGRVLPLGFRKALPGWRAEQGFPRDDLGGAASSVCPQALLPGALQLQGWMWLLPKGPGARASPARYAVVAPVTRCMLPLECQRSPCFSVRAKVPAPLPPNPPRPSCCSPPLQVPRAVVPHPYPYPFRSLLLGQLLWCFVPPHSTCCPSTCWAPGTYISCNVCGVGSVLDARSLRAQTSPAPSPTGRALLKT